MSGYVVIIIAMAASAWLVLRRRDTFVSGNIVGIQADLKRAGIEDDLHAASAGVADSAQALGCAYLAELTSAVQSYVRTAKDRLPCSAVTDQLRRVQNAMEARVRASKLAAGTKAKMMDYVQSAVDTVRAVFDPLCRNGSFDTRAAQSALEGIQVSYCAALPTPRKDAAAKPPGLNKPALTAAVQAAQRAVTESRKRGGTPSPAAQARLAAARRALSASNASAKAAAAKATAKTRKAVPDAGKPSATAKKSSHK